MWADHFEDLGKTLVSFTLMTFSTGLSLVSEKSLYTVFFYESSVHKILKTGLALHLFKGKGAKADNRGNYRGIILFPTQCKIYEMIILMTIIQFDKTDGIT